LTADLSIVPAVLLGVPAALLVVQVRRHADDPPALGAARLGTLALLLAVAAVLLVAQRLSWGVAL
jgi:hypothetical protein